MEKSYWQELFKDRPYRRFSEEDRLDSMSEECGVFGVYSPKTIDTFSLAEFGMFALQHRGQEACGVSVLKNGQIITSKRNGLVLDLYKYIADSEDFQGNAAIGHTRYSTTGGNSTRNIQPFYATNQHGKTHISFVHNGNLVDYEDIRQELIDEDLPFLTADSDSEVLLRLIQKYLVDNDLIEAIKKATARIKGAYSVLMLTKDGLIAFRDPNGIRPLCIGKLDKDTYVFSSENCGLNAVGATFLRDIKPGELVYCSKNGLESHDLTHEEKKQRICAFEYIYFSRPDSVIENIDVFNVRKQSGKKLHEQYPVDADVVIGVPDSGVAAAMGYSESSGIPFHPILIKNRYMSRSFIIPSQDMRERVVNLKLNPIIPEIRGKRLIVIDDSIVRGTTSKRLVDILWESGAKEIHFRSASPPIIAPCFLGIDMPTKKDLISANMNRQELVDYLKVDTLDFLTVENLTEILGSLNHCFGCFTEKYPVERKESKEKVWQKKISL
jgi:amidophosphoribosyltransferase